MAGGKETKAKIKSVQNTQKITRAMEMVAASKMRRAQDRLDQARPYAEKIRRTIQHMAQANLGSNTHPFMVDREVSRVALLVVTTDRGLCGGLNVNLFRSVLAEMRAWQDKGVEVEIVCLGHKGVNFLRRFTDLKANVTDLGDQPQVGDLVGTVKVVLDDFRNKSIDRFYMVSNEFVNTMTQKPTVTQLLPVAEGDGDKSNVPDHWDYIYEPDAESLLDDFLVRYVESQVYQGAVENVACEMAARMVAMKAASDNAGDIIDDLQLKYNKQRQASITQELSEIVAGAAAVS